MNPMQHILRLPIRAYQLLISPLFPNSCRHQPSCAAYGLQAIKDHGAWCGGWLTLARLLRCNPFGTEGYDPVPGQWMCISATAPWRHGLWNKTNKVRVS